MGTSSWINSLKGTTLCLISPAMSMKNGLRKCEKLFTFVAMNKLKSMKIFAILLGSIGPRSASVIRFRKESWCSILSEHDLVAVLSCKAEWALYDHQGGNDKGGSPSSTHLFSSYGLHDNGNGEAKLPCLYCSTKYGRDTNIIGNDADGSVQWRVSSHSGKVFVWFYDFMSSTYPENAKPMLELDQKT